MPNVIIVRNIYPDIGSLKRVSRYVKECAYVGGYAVNPEYAFDEMRLIKEAHHKTEGVQLKHFLITFSNREILELDFDDLHVLAVNVGRLFGEYQMVYGIHTDAKYVHLHFCMNTVSFIDGKKYSDGLAGFNKVKNLLVQTYPKFHTEVIFREKFVPGEFRNNT